MLLKMLSISNIRSCNLNAEEEKKSTLLSLSCLLAGGRVPPAEDLRGMSELGGLRGLEGRSAGAGSVHSAEMRLSAHRRGRAQ